MNRRSPGRLRRRHEFQQVYDQGSRAHGRLMTVFLLPTDAGATRLGIAATRKLGGAVQRNRAKRLLRETFRLSDLLLRELGKNYDWVLNAKAAVLSQKVDAPCQELMGIIEKVGRLETHEPVK